MTAAATATWSASTGAVLGFDTETTGVDVSADRIVAAALVLRGDGGTRVRTWLINPGVEIPEVATSVHGICTASVRRSGRRAADALVEIADEIAVAQRAGVPLVAYNAAFDLAILDAEIRRHGLPDLTARIGRACGPVLDPLVLDRALDPGREGRRTLGDLCLHYGVVGEGALHTAEVDVVATLDVLDRMAERFPRLWLTSAQDLHHFQRERHRSWAEAHNARTARPEAEAEAERIAETPPVAEAEARRPARARTPVDPSWPVAGTGSCEDSDVVPEPQEV